MARLNDGVERSHDSPMEYAWTDGRGPVDHTSPFVQNGKTAEDQRWAAGQKRPSSELDSPQKENIPRLRDPDNQKFLFSSNTLPAIKSNWSSFRDNTAFLTPQKPKIDLDDTSGPEQSSPAYADSEATPDPPRASSPTKFQNSAVRFQGSKVDESSSKNNPLSKAGRGEIPKRSGYTDMLHRKIDKRRRRITDRDVQNAPRRYKEDSDTEERPSSNDNHSRNPQRDRKKPSQGMGFIPSVLTFIDAHPTLPNTLSYYVQFFLNCFFAGCFMYVLWGVFSTIRHDIDERAIAESSEILAEMAACAREFKENRCERDTRVPAMEMVCSNWEKCMARDPYKVGRSRLSAGMFAEIFNSFVEPISIKALVVSVSVIVGCFAVNNLTFGIYRSRHQSPSHPAPSQPAYMPHQQPQSQLGFASPAYGHLQTPYHYQLGDIPQQSDMNWHREGSPTKRLEYR